MSRNNYPNGVYPNPQIVNQGYFYGAEARALAANSCTGGPCGVPATPPGVYNPAVQPLMSFADPGLCNTCVGRPIVNPCSRRQVAVTTWTVNYLVSNVPNAASHVDLALINPWGIVVWENRLWIAAGFTDSILNFDIYGNQGLRPITIRDTVHNSSYPTGIVINCDGGFPVTNGNNTKSALILTCTEHGTVHAYNPEVNQTQSYVVINMQITGRVSVFKGMCVAYGIMYLANFFQGVIDVFSSEYIRLPNYRFIDGDTSDPIPGDYGPNNIVHIGTFLYVLWARKAPSLTLHDFDGPGHGFISQFNLDGSFVRRFTSRGCLNSPWAMIEAPPGECGIPPCSFLVGNNGDGRINIFDHDGRWVGPLLSRSGVPIQIEGLWGLAPLYTDVNFIYYTAAPNENIDGTIGCLTPSQIIQI